MRATDIFGGLALLATAGVLVITVMTALSLPVVYESYSTGRCVKVVDPAGQYSCQKMPTKYTHEWVQ